MIDYKIICTVALDQHIRFAVHVVELETEEKLCLKHYFWLSKEEKNQRKLEIKCMKYLQNIPKVVQIYAQEIIEDSENGYEVKIFMEYLGSQNLENFLLETIEESKFLEKNWLMNEIQELLNLFSYMQQNLICHRDIRPENIMVAEGYVLKLINFSEGKKIIGNRHSFVGHHTYLSPEMRQRYLNPGFVFDEYKSDVWSLGLVFLRMATLCDVNFINDEDLQQDVDRLIETISCEWIKKVVRTMLRVRQEDRRNFCELEEFANSLCRDCGETASIENICQLCKGEFHCHVGVVAFELSGDFLDWIKTKFGFPFIGCVECYFERLIPEYDRELVNSQ